MVKCFGWREFDRDDIKQSDVCTLDSKTRQIVIKRENRPESDDYEMWRVRVPTQVLNVISRSVLHEDHSKK